MGHHAGVAAPQERGLSPGAARSRTSCPRSRGNRQENEENQRTEGRKRYNETAFQRFRSEMLQG